MTVDESFGWRFIVEEIGEMPERHGFATLELLLAFLHREFADQQEKFDQKE